jgi:hypothetical protein
MVHGALTEKALKQVQGRGSNKMVQDALVPVEYSGVRGKLIHEKNLK